jgi:hypothetical protein
MAKYQALDRRQLRSLSLAGTVALPSPFPELGKISLQAGGVVYQGGQGESPKEDLVVIEHVQSNRVTLTRRVFLRDVMAVAFAPIDESTNNWFFGPEIARELRARSSDNKPELMEGIAYVREDAPVLMEVEVSMTAAESADFYPPVPERADDDYLLHVGAHCHREKCCPRICHYPEMKGALTPCHKPKRSP